uniref:Uncharacterized protein n=1 Tax=Oryza nivara TaxID=4536 RepID=A0A0E0FLS0_ORYNI
MSTEGCSSWRCCRRRVGRNLLVFWTAACFPSASEYCLHLPLLQSSPAQFHRHPSPFPPRPSATASSFSTLLSPATPPYLLTSSLHLADASWGRPDPAFLSSKPPDPSPS